MRHRVVSEAKMRNAPIFVSAVLAALSITQASTSHRTQRTETVRSRLITVITDRDLHAVVAFCLIGLLLALNFIHRFPDLGAVIEQYNQF
ncbi:MAG: hypothetical protein WBE90_27330 [Xanthobacteraceae bacterium]|jgi:hypothetical protein